MSLKELLAEQKAALAAADAGFASYSAAKNEQWWNGFWVFTKIPPAVAAASLQAEDCAASSPVKTSEDRKRVKHMLCGLQDASVWLQQEDGKLRGVVFDGQGAFELRPTPLSASMMLCEGGALHHVGNGALLSPIAFKIGYAKNTIAATFNWKLRVDGGTFAAAEEVTLSRAFPRLVTLSASFEVLDTLDLLSPAGSLRSNAPNAPDPTHELAPGKLATLVAERCPTHFELAPVVGTSAAAVTRLLGVPAASAADLAVGDGNDESVSAHVATVPLDRFRDVVSLGSAPAAAEGMQLVVHTEHEGGAWGLDLAGVHAATRRHARMLLLPTPRAREQAQMHASRYHHATAHLHVQVVVQPPPPVERSESGVPTAPPAQPTVLGVRPVVWRERYVEGMRRLDGIARVDTRRGHDGTPPSVDADVWGPAAAASLADDLIRRITATGRM